MKLKMSPAWLALLCLCDGCIFAESEYTPATGGLDQGADMTRADMSADLSEPDQRDDSSPDEDMPIGPDLDMDPDAGDMSDQGECPSIAQQCKMLGFQCGEQSGFFDQCAPETTLDCGVCEGPEPLTCQRGQCVKECIPRDMETLCLEGGYRCGQRSVMECDKTIELRCGDCGDDPSVVCTGENLCCDKIAERERLRAEQLSQGKCGVIEVEACGERQTLALETSCEGYAAQMNKEPGFYQCEQNQCVCRPETNAELCSDAGRVCGPLPTVVDRCGASRSDITCPDTCTGGLVRCCPMQNACKLLANLNCS